MLRIVGGDFSGIRLKAPSGQQTRPTTDIVREATFNMLQNLVIAGPCLDLYAGSGALGIEAFSRWGTAVYLVDRSKAAVAIMRDNIAKLHQVQAFHILPINAQRALRQFQVDQVQFALVFLDPPYHYQNQNQDLAQIIEMQLVLPGAIVVCQGDQNLQVAKLSNLSLLKSKKYGKTLIDIYRVMK